MNNGDIRAIRSFRSFLFWLLFSKSLNMNIIQVPNTKAVCDENSKIICSQTKVQTTAEAYAVLRICRHFASFSDIHDSKSYSEQMLEL